MQSKAEQRLEGRFALPPPLPPVSASFPPPGRHLHVLSREIGLQVADEDEQQRKASKKKKSESGAEEKEVEHWVEKRQRKRARKEEEAQKRKRTVFVGNLPVSCTKKVGRERSSSTLRRRFTPDPGPCPVSDAAEPVQRRRHHRVRPVPLCGKTISRFCGCSLRAAPQTQVRL